MKKGREPVEAVKVLLATYGIKYSLEFKKHVLFRFEVNGHRLQYFTGGSVSDRRAVDNAICCVRRIIRRAQQETPPCRPTTN